MATVRCPLFTAGSTLLVLAVALAVVPLCSAAAGSQRNSTLATAAAAASANETAHSEGSGNDTPAPPSDPVLPDVKAAAVDDKASNFEAALAWDGLSEENLLKYRKRLSALAAQRWKLTKAQAAAAGDPSLEGKIRVCVYPSTPYVSGPVRARARGGAGGAAAAGAAGATRGRARCGRAGRRMRARARARTAAQQAKAIHPGIWLQARAAAHACTRAAFGAAPRPSAGASPSHAPLAPAPALRPPSPVVLQHLGPRDRVRRLRC